MTRSIPTGHVLAVSARSGHHFSKAPALSIRLLRELGVAGDAHMDETVKHGSRVRKDPTAGDAIRVELPAAPHHPLQPV